MKKVNLNGIIDLIIMNNNNNDEEEKRYLKSVHYT